LNFNNILTFELIFPSYEISATTVTFLKFKLFLIIFLALRLPSNIFFEVIYRLYPRQFHKIFPSQMLETTVNDHRILFMTNVIF